MMRGHQHGRLQPFTVVMRQPGFGRRLDIACQENFPVTAGNLQHTGIVIFSFKALFAGRAG